MAFRGGRLCFILVLIAYHSLECQGCSCSHPSYHIQTSLCRATFVIKALVKSRDPDKPGYAALALDRDRDGFRDYGLKVKNVFKFPSNVTKRFNLSIKGGIGGSMCSVWLEVGETYLLAGYELFNGHLWVEACNSVVRRWDSLNAHTKHLLQRGRYFKGCDCKIKPCVKRPCPNLKSTDTCLYYTKADSSRCVYDAAYCKRNGRTESCRWKKGAEYRKCDEGRNQK